MSTENVHESWLTAILRKDPDILHDAATMAAMRELDDDTGLALRHMLDRYIRDTVRWPREQDYAQIARDLERAGDPHMAALVREVASDELLDEVTARWEHRYVNRPDPWEERSPQELCDERQIDYSDGDPAQGVDGASYALGYIEEGTHCGHVVAVHSRGMAEAVTFGDDEEAQRRWLADRGPTATGELITPGTAMASRVVREEKILASLLKDPEAFPGTVTRLPPDTFTSDSRYEIYAAMTAVAEGRRRWYPWQLGYEIARRVELLPQDTLRVYGGPDAPWLHTYLQRLTVTPVSIDDGDAAARSVLEEDARVRQVPGWYTIIAERAARIPVAEPRQQPDVDRWERRRAELGGQAQPQRPPEAFSGPAGPLPRM